MHVRHDSDEAQAEAVAESVAAALQAVESLEHLLALLSRNSRPVIGDRNERYAVTLGDLYGHLRRFTAELDGIVDHIGNRIEQKIPITGDEYALLPAHVDSAAPLLSHSVKELYDVVRDLCEVHRAKCKVSIVAPDLRELAKGDFGCETRQVLSSQKSFFSLSVSGYFVAD